MNINGFRRWLRAQIASFDDDSDSAADRADEAVSIIREAKKIAIDLALPEIARHCATVKTTMLALPVAQHVLCECLAMLPNEKPDSLTPPQVAKRLGVSPDKVLSWIRKGELHAVNVTAKPGGRPKYRVAPADLEAFRLRRSPQAKVKTPRARPSGKMSGKIYV